MSRSGTPAKRKPYVQSLDRGLLLMELLTYAEGPTTLAQLSEVLGVERSTVLRLLSTLEQRGYVQQDPGTRGYGMGVKVVELSRVIIDRLNVRSIAKAFLGRLVSATGESANLAIPAGRAGVCVDCEPSPSSLAVTNEIGFSFAPHATACGKVFLAAALESEGVQALPAEPLRAYTARTITDLPTLRAHLRTVLEQGYAADDEEWDVGVRCVAAPVYDHRGRVIAAISVSGPASRVTVDGIPRLADLVTSAAAGVSRQLGASGEGSEWVGWSTTDPSVDGESQHRSTRATRARKPAPTQRKEG
jgi:IclR family acetate operon transcriptional repressor